jgi:spore photoproduct lyase
MSLTTKFEARNLKLETIPKFADSKGPNKARVAAKIVRLFVDQAVKDSPLIATFQSKLALTPVVVDHLQEVYQTLRTAPDPIQKGKQVLYLTRNQGAFIKECPGTRAYTCCGYKILHIGTYCTMDCAYCILQSYFHPPVLQYFLNQQDLETELNNLLLADRKIQRIGTGEFTDSLIWESWCDVSRRLVPIFARQSHAVLELKTKTTAIQGFANLDHNRKTIMAWSLNTPAVIRGEERGTASLGARLKAAARCESWGYPVAFHFDPLIIYDGCERAYCQVIDQIFTHVSAQNIVWISLGTFRFMPDLKPIVASRFPESKIIYGEFVQGIDGKMRYFKPLRVRLYRRLVECIRSYSDEVTVYFCMEDDEVWHKTLGFVPDAKGGLPHMLDASAAKHCGLKIG